MGSRSVEVDGSTPDKHGGHMMRRARTPGAMVVATKKHMVLVWRRDRDPRLPASLTRAQGRPLLRADAGSYRHFYPGIQVLTVVVCLESLVQVDF